MALSVRNKLPRIMVMMTRHMSGHEEGLFYHDGKELAGNRELVGFGRSGNYDYYDGHDMPFPALRFRPDDATSKALRDKEKGDWKKLTIEEKKALYRHSFCQTFAEFQAPDAEWKVVIGYTLVFVAIGWLTYLGASQLMPQHPYREFYDSHEVRAATEQRRLDFGIESDYGKYWDKEKRQMRD